ncbi:MAG: MerR family transcriptional regulator [Betaproteobacteria bacterium]|nr:MerR family transcriptional regulator [Betaproteobacteria bacterium]MDE2124905.1 MerR family transcriptional regulator [Betaproteobacteria bacterium]MDE2185502.1 MerR family transcriptional regulator [Betaproteobacteria bacterium]MDE2326152.1 MerR family transcriptional regulator [Betaproteobacteria bacterium]
MQTHALTCTTMDEGVLLDLRDLTRACAQPETWVMELVQVGILEPLSGPAHKPGDWRFAGQALFTARKVQHLQQDLGVNLEGAALALELMQQLDALRARLARAGGFD